MIDTEKLKAKIEKRIEEEKARQVERIAEHEKKRAEEKLAWLEQYGDRWRTAAHDILGALSNKEPVTRDMIPGGSWPKAWDGTRSVPDSEYQPPSAVRTLLAALELLDEPKVSHNALEKMGLNAETMRGVSRFLGGAAS